MATDYITTITLMRYDLAMGFRLRSDANGLDGRDLLDITISLLAGQSFVFESVTVEAPNGTEVDGWHASLIVSDKNISDSVGSFLYGSDPG
jgi:hypothetical protein